MEKLTLIKTIVVRHDHWMTPGRKPTIMCGTKTLEVPSVAAIKMIHTDRYLFGSDTYDVVLFEGKRFKLSHDLSTGQWTATRKIVLGPEAEPTPLTVGVYKDFTPEAQSQMEGWEIS